MPLASLDGPAPTVTPSVTKTCAAVKLPSMKGMESVVRNLLFVFPNLIIEFNEFPLFI